MSSPDNRTPVNDRNGIRDLPQNWKASPNLDDEVFPDLSYLIDNTYDTFNTWPQADLNDLDGWAPQNIKALPSAGFEAQGNITQSSDMPHLSQYGIVDPHHGSPYQMPMAPEEVMSTVDMREQDGRNFRQDAVDTESPHLKNESDESDKTAYSPPVRKLPAVREPRVREGWKMSDAHQTVSEDFSAGPDVRDMQHGTESGRNWFVKFGRDDTPRLRCNLNIKRAKEDKNTGAAVQWPDPNKEHIPAKTSLDEICQKYPRHVWGTGLRLFGSEGWDAKRIYDNLPDNFRHKGAKTRKWNYLQAALGRELDKMVEEEGRPRSAPKRGSKRKASESECKEDDKSPDVAPKRQCRPKMEFQAHIPAGPWPVVPSSTMQRLTAAHPPTLQMPSAQVSVADSSFLNQTPHSTLGRGANNSSVRGLANPNTTPMEPQMMAAARMAMQPTIRQLPGWCQQERRKHRHLARQVFAVARGVDFQIADERIKNFIFEQWWYGKLQEWASAVAAQYGARGYRQVLTIEDGVDMLVEIVEGSREDWSPEQCKERAWLWMWNELRAWTTQLGGN